MAYWIELRCEDRAEDYADGRVVIGGVERCWSHDNEGCGELADDTADGLNKTRQSVALNARSAGWTLKRGHGWICPFCTSERKRLNIK